MKVSIVFITAITLFLSCNSQKTKENNDNFKVTYHNIIVDTFISDIHYWNRHLILYDQLGKVTAYDEEMKLDSEITNQFQHLNRDTLMASKPDVVPIDKQMDAKFSEKAMYSDSNYRVYFVYPPCTTDGDENSYGSIFFFNKHSKKWFYFPTIVIRQFFKTSTGYFLCNVHNAYLIKNPDDLIKVENEIQLGVSHPYWYIRSKRLLSKEYTTSHYIDSIYKQYQDIVTVDRTPYDIASAFFMRHDSVFSVRLTNSATIIGKYINNRFAILDSFYHDSLPNCHFDLRNVILKNGHSITCFDVERKWDSEQENSTEFDVIYAIIDVSDNNIHITQVKKKHFSRKD